MAPPFALHTCVLAALSLHSVAASPAPQPKVVALDVHRRSVSASDILPRRLSRRASTASASLANAQLLYYINVTVGTPSQSLTLQLDTGSSDVWVPASDSNICSSNSDLCGEGTFNAERSSTFSPGQEDGFQIGYGDGTQVQGEYFNDTLSIAGVTLNNLTMGLAQSQTNAPGGDTAQFYGLVGVGFDANEAIASQTGFTYSYPDIVSQLVAQDKINTRAFSLWLNDFDSASGSILFGGVDTKKYSGDLTVLPLQKDDQCGFICSFTVALAGVSLTGGGKTVYSSKSTAAVLLDSGTSITYLPSEIANEIMSGVGAVNDTSIDIIVPCSLADTDGEFQFQFGDANGPIIRVPIAEFVLTFGSNPPTFKDGTPACRWGIQPGNDPGGYLFGDTFLRSAYVVYNIDGQTLAIAQTQFDATDSDIKVITATDSIPGATSTASGTAPVSASGAVGGAVIPVATAIDSIPSATGSFSFSSGTASGSGSSSTSSPTKGAAAGVLAPSTPFVGTMVASFSVFFAMLGGSMLILT